MTNLYRNPTFTNLTEWLKASADESEPRIAEDQSSDWKEPNVTASGTETVIELSYGPFWTAFYQAVTGLTLGAVYKISWNVTATMRHPDDSSPAADPLSAEARIKAGTKTGPWFDGATLKHGQSTNLSATFTATSTSDNLGVEVRARHSLWRNHFVLSSPLLELVSSPTPAPVGGAPTDKLALLTTLVTALDVRIGLVEAVLNGLKADRDAILTELLRIRNLPGD